MSPNSPQVENDTGIADYLELVKFLLEPSLETPESLSVDLESLNENQRIWLRVAFADEDKGKVFGRGGRNIQSIRTILQVAAQQRNQSIHLDIYGSSRNTSSSGSRRGSEHSTGNDEQRSVNSKPKPKPSLKSRSE